MSVAQGAPRRTHRWFAWDATTHSDARLAELKFDHGPAALAAYAVLLGEAKRTRDDGTVGLSYRLLAELIGLDGPKTARAVLEAMHEVELLQATFTDKGVEGRILDWHKLQPQRQLANDRKARQRERERATVEPETAEEEVAETVTTPGAQAAAAALAAPRCACANPLLSVDEDGDRACARCGRAPGDDVNPNGRPQQ